MKNLIRNKKRHDELLPLYSKLNNQKRKRVLNLLLINEIETKIVQWHKNNPIIYALPNIDKIRLQNRNFHRNERINNIQYRIAENLRSRVGAAIRNKSKKGSAIKDMGCSILELKLHLEKQFKDGMSWNNWKPNGWHIDHIKPLSKFDLCIREEFLKACHYTNLQPLWAQDNFSKHNKIII